ncbi:MAG TPA: hypothetical protein VIS99_15695 [Terrimicrobiaceae bacterium]
MNSLLSRPVLDAMGVFLSLAPTGVALQGWFPLSPFAPYRSGVNLGLTNIPRNWAYPEVHQSVPQFPQLVTASGERALATFWR